MNRRVALSMQLRTVMLRATVPDWSVQDARATAGMSQSCWSQYNTGRSPWDPSRAVRDRIALALELPDGDALLWDPVRIVSYTQQETTT